MLRRTFLEITVQIFVCGHNEKVPGANSTGCPPSPSLRERPPDTRTFGESLYFTLYRVNSWDRVKLTSTNVECTPMEFWKHLIAYSTICVYFSFTSHPTSSQQNKECKVPLGNFTDFSNIMRRKVFYVPWYFQMIFFSNEKNLRPSRNILEDQFFYLSQWKWISLSKFKKWWFCKMLNTAYKMWTSGPILLKISQGAIRMCPNLENFFDEFT